MAPAQGRQGIEGGGVGAQLRQACPPGPFEMPGQTPEAGDDPDRGHVEVRPLAGPRLLDVVDRVPHQGLLDRGPIFLLALR